MSSRRQYPFDLIEPKWQRVWDAEQTFRAFNPGESVPDGHPFGVRHSLAGKPASAAQLPPKFYILDMFPYPSGAGLHVGHPEGYTATDILARYRRAKGFNVLHPMGWDSFGLPAEQYAVKTGQHPRVTTEANIANFTRQIKSLGFSYDWSRELATTDPGYFRWTQWIFLQLYHAWFNQETNRAEPISTLKYPPDLDGARLFKPQQAAPGVASPNSETAAAHAAGCGLESRAPGDLESSRRAWRDSKRLAYVSEQPVWWCEGLGTVLANEEVVDGKSEVGGFPVVRKPMRQWVLRITAFAERLLDDLDTIEWTDSLKEMQRNWIGRSEGAEVAFQTSFETKKSYAVAHSTFVISVFTTRPDTLFGATYIVLAPEHVFIDVWLEQDFIPAAWPGGTSEIWTGGAATPKEAISRYREACAKKSDLERTELAKEKTGVFTGAYAMNPVNGEKIPIWIADYVLASYGTGAIMAVPAHDERDFEFAKKFGLAIRHVVAEPGYSSLDMRERNLGERRKISNVLQNKEGTEDIGSWTEGEPFIGEGIAFNSPLIDRLPTAEAKAKITAWLDAKGLGKKTINYKLRDWLFSRQRYWGEPFPIVWRRDASGQPYHEALPESALPLLPPVLTDYKPTASGEPPLARAKDWVNLPDGAVREVNTMPQWAGSCWYYLRYLDARRSESFVGTLAEHYWMGGPCEGLLLTPAQWASRLRELFDFAVTDTANQKRFVNFDVVDEGEARQVFQATGLEVKGYRRFLDTFAIRHILKEHGDPESEARRGQIAVTFDDFLLIPEVVCHPDRVLPAAKTATGREAILYEKCINGWLCYVEEVREGRGLLATKTLYKKEATASRATEGGLAQTPEALRRSETNNAPAAPAVNPTSPSSHVASTRPTPGVDLYVGGTEHAVLHLLYSRFWHKVLFDLGHVSTAEPFFKLVNQGIILGEDGQKMSKSRGNAVNPDDVLVEFGADAFRLYEMFMGPLQDTKPWNTRGVEGVYRFLGRVWRLFIEEKSETAFEQAQTVATQPDADLLDHLVMNGTIADVSATPAQLKALHACIKKVTEDLDHLRFNTAISAMMVFVNEANGWQTRPFAVMRTFLQLLAPFAPHIVEELWARLHRTFGQNPPSLGYAAWPSYDPALLVESEVEIPVSVNGKHRDVIRVSADADNATLEAAAKAAEKVQPFLEGKSVKKVIIVPKKMVNLVVG